MGKIFLGKLWHWALLLLASGLLWYCGANRLHVIEFNLFILSMLLGTAASILGLVWLHKDGEQVTREVLIEHVFDPNEDTRLSRE